MSSAPRIGFAGTPEFAAIVLDAILRDGQEVVVVYTQPDRRAGRGRKLTSSPVKQLALANRLPLRQPTSLRGKTPAAELAECNLDVLVVAAYGLILPESVLVAPKYGCINVHASLLPRWRGAAPVERAIMAGDAETGVSIMQMDAGLDTGPVLARSKCPIDEDVSGPELGAALARLGAQCLLACLANLDALTPEPQREADACYAAKLATEDAVIDWHRPSRDIHRQVRALCGRLPATTSIDDLTIKILAARWSPDPPSATPGTIESATRKGIKVACGGGSLVIEQLQLNRGKGLPLAAADAINGYPALFEPGARVVDTP
jgi:methionyl-tRNA formyltransferase